MKNIRFRILRRLSFASSWLCAGLCTINASSALPMGLDSLHDTNPFPSTYRPGPASFIAITNVSILTGRGDQIDNGTVILRDGKIAAIGKDIPVPPEASVLDGRGKWVTPGIIDPHSHLGVAPSPGVKGTADVNEKTDPNTANVWAENSIWPQDPGFTRARAAGVTSMQILPGSANLFGGRTVVIKNVPAVTAQAMKFPGAPYGLKMACGENPKGDYGDHGRFPATRMGEFAGYRRAWIEATDYMAKWDAYAQKISKGLSAEAPKRDLAMDTLSGVLRGQIRVNMHCYRADEMANALDVAKEFGFALTGFHHAVEAYKIADLLKANNTCAVVWGNGRWGFKMEAYDGIEENAAILQKAGVCVALHSDSPIVNQHLNLTAAISLAAGRRVGIDVPESVAIEWLTANPAKLLGIDSQTGTLEPGKDADVVLWSANPFSIYAVPEKVFIDGSLVFDKNKGEKPSDFELGQQRGAL